MKEKFLMKKLKVLTKKYLIFNMKYLIYKITNKILINKLNKDKDVNPSLIFIFEKDI